MSTPTGYETEEVANNLVKQAHETLNSPTKENKQAAKDLFEQAAGIYQNCQLPAKAAEAQRQADSIVV